MKNIISFFIIFFCSTTILLEASDIKKSTILESYGKIPLEFTTNSGQLDSQVKFTTRGYGAAMFFTQEGTTFLLSRGKEKSIIKRKNQTLEKKNRNIKFDRTLNPLEERESEIEKEYYALKKYFVNANPNPEITGEGLLPWYNNYFIGNDPAKYSTEVPNYAKIQLKNIYDGIDLFYYGNKKSIKYDFVVQPGENPEQIVLMYDFGNISVAEGSISINQNGELVVKTPFGNMIERKPYCYQVIDGEKVEVEVQYKIISQKHNKFTFHISHYNPAFPLIIDPELIYSTYIGGSSDEYCYGIALDGDNNAYITGYTESTGFPTTSGVWDLIHNGSADVFVSKLNSSGTALTYSTFIGSNYDDKAYGIAVDESGNAYITGKTLSNNFPTTSGAIDVTFNGSPNGDSDVFVCKLNSMGSALTYSTFLGGSSNDYGQGIALDANRSAYITGYTYSSGFPKTIGAYDIYRNGTI